MPRPALRSATAEEMTSSQRQQMWTAGLLALITVLSLVGVLLTRHIATEMEVTVLNSEITMTVLYFIGKGIQIIVTWPLKE